MSDTIQTIRANIYKIQPPEQYGAKGATLRRVWLTWDAGFGDKKWTKYLEITFRNKKADSPAFESLKPGQLVEVVYAISGRLWTKDDGTERIFNTIDGVSITPVAAAPGNFRTQPDPYDPTHRYRPGDTCLQDGKIYKLRADGTAWDIVPEDDKASYPVGDPRNGQSMDGLPF